jgi:hypothetical protein
MGKQNNRILSTPQGTLSPAVKKGEKKEAIHRTASARDPGHPLRSVAMKAMKAKKATKAMKATPGTIDMP